MVRTVVDIFQLKQNGKDKRVGDTLTWSGTEQRVHFLLLRRNKIKDRFISLEIVGYCIWFVFSYTWSITCVFSWTRFWGSASLRVIPNPRLGKLSTPTGVSLKNQFWLEVAGRTVEIKQQAIGDSNKSLIWSNMMTNYGGGENGCHNTIVLMMI